MSAAGFGPSSPPVLLAWVLLPVVLVVEVVLLLLPCAGMVGGRNLVPFWWREMSSADIFWQRIRPCLQPRLDNGL